ncbi:prepilin peptidase [Candidatus Babeliales bacterium]|nr:prepilin peptidase [Candidatus Babeliales bacterium]
MNVLSHRITFDKKLFFKRSHCPHCSGIISWYNNIPLFSWVFLKGKCKKCNKPISILYPFIELFSGVVHTYLFFNEFTFDLHPRFVGSLNIAVGSFLSYFVFFSALICATRSDFERMVIPQIFTLWLVPIGIFSAYLGLIKILFYDSLFGAIFGYAFLWVVGKVFKFFTKKDGIGEGDMELLALIGSFLGVFGMYFSLMIGSVIGLILGGVYLFIKNKNRNSKIPFGPFLVLGAIFYFFFIQI